MNNKKIIIGVLANNQNGYDKMVKAAKETCYLNKSEFDIEVYYLYGRGNGVEIPHDSYIVKDDNFYFDSEESYYNLLPKTVEFFEFCLKNKEFDYIFRTNCGSYIDLNAINEFCKLLGNENIYCGVEGSFNNVSFASGSGFFISKDIVEKIVKNKHILYNYAKNLMDDVSIGHFLCKDLNINVLKGAIRKDITIKNNQIDILNTSGLDNNLPIDKKCYHYYFSHAYGLSHGPEFFDIVKKELDK